MSDKKTLVEKVLKLFSLGDASRNPNEAEVNAAITRARELMTEHAISDADLLAYGTAKAKKVAILVKDEVAYTLKRGSFAAYDTGIARTVDAICDTHNYVVDSHTPSGKFISRRFFGAEADVAVAVALFNRLMDTMKNMAKVQYGTRWSTPHSSYCLGLAVRLMNRARELYAKTETMLETTGHTGTALMLRDKRAVVDEHAKKLGLKTTKPRSQKVDAGAWDRGTQAADSIDLGNPRRRID